MWRTISRKTIRTAKHLWDLPISGCRLTPCITGNDRTLSKRKIQCSSLKFVKIVSLFREFRFWKPLLLLKIISIIKVLQNVCYIISFSDRFLMKVHRRWVLVPGPATRSPCAKESQDQLNQFPKRSRTICGMVSNSPIQSVVLIFITSVFILFQLWRVRRLCLTEGSTPTVKSPLDPVLFMTLPQGAIVQDASLPVLTLLRILHAISRYWGTLYPAVNYKPLLSLQVWIVEDRTDS